MWHFIKFYRYNFAFKFHMEFLIMKKLFFVLLSLYLALQAETKNTPAISVSIAPQAFFVNKITNNSLPVNIILPNNTDEHNFEFKIETMKALEKSEIYFTMGLEFEEVFKDKFQQNFPHIQVVNMQDGITLAHSEDAHEHHDKDGAHDLNDPHTWLDPVLVKIMASNIAKNLSEKYPQNAKFYAQNLKDFQKELDELNDKITKELSDLKNRKFIVYHPSWAYFAKRYNLEQIPVEINGKEPKAKDLQQLITLAQKEQIKAIFVQPGFPESAAKTLAKECGAKVISINHLSKDWESELLKSVQALRQNLK